jgi:hypothetical protein
MAFIGNQIITINSLLDLDGQELVLDADADSTIHVSTDDQIDFRAGGTDVMTLSTTGLTITNASNDTQLTLKSTDADSSSGPVLDLFRDSGSPADSDVIGQINFSADDDAGNQSTFFRIRAQATDVSEGSEDATVYLNSVVAGSMRERLTIKSNEIAINDDSHDFDFRVESNGEENMLFVDGGENRVGIGTTGGSGETLTVTKSGADATVRVNGVSGQEASLKLQGNNTITNTFKIASEEDDSGLTIQKWNGSAYVTHLKSDANGHITMPLQPAFLVQPSSQQDNIPINGSTTVVFDTERFDQNGDFSSNTFTAPVTGRYQLNVQLMIQQMDKDTDYIGVELRTSNRVYTVYHDNDGMAADMPNGEEKNIIVLADMDENDTAFVVLSLPNSGAAQMDVTTLSAFSGFLAC